jgi:hypothetical protein
MKVQTDTTKVQNREVWSVLTLQRNVVGLLGVIVGVLGAQPWSVVVSEYSSFVLEAHLWSFVVFQAPLFNVPVISCMCIVI